MRQEKIWDHFQGDTQGLKTFAHAQPRYAYLAARLPAGARVLNVGVGDGGLERLLLGKGVEVFSLDPGEAAIERLRKNFSLDEERARQGYIETAPFPAEVFDFVILSEVLEHLGDETLAAALNEVRRMLKPGGVFMGTVPADEDISANMVVCPDCGKLFHRWGHVRSLSETGLHDLIADVFPEVLEIRRTVFGYDTGLNWKGRLSWVLKRFAIIAGLRGSGESWFFRARKVART